MSEAGARTDGDALVFGPFQLFPSRRILIENGRQVRLGGRAMELLIALVERAGEVVTKRELLSLVWPHAMVDETNLRVHIAAIRKVLGDGQGGAHYIVNVSGHGYLFSLPVERSVTVTRIDPPREGRSNAFLSKGLSRIVGRDVVVEGLLVKLQARRLVSVVGPAGVGKSTVALAMSEQCGALGSDGVYFVELSAIEGAELVPAAVATALGVSVTTGDPLGSLSAFLSDRQVLIVLDNCEHVVSAVAALVETILFASEQVRFLTTSREPLLAQDEWVFRLGPLDMPEEGLELTPSEAMTYPAVQLFMERAMNSSETITFGEVEAASVVEICRRLDGLPLAIELAAARVDLFGLRGLATALNDRMMLIARRSRSVQTRQQSIMGALDWSYELLSEVEKRVLERFSIFRGSFTLESAAAVASGQGVAVEQVLDAVASLTAKSLVATDPSGPAMLYRLLRVTGAYAREKAAATGQDASLARRHAQHHRDLMAAAEARWDTLSRAEWVEEFGYTIDDIRAALEWAFGPDGDVEIGAALTIASLPFGFQLCLIDEFNRRAGLALELLRTLDPPNLLAELRLSAVRTVLHLNCSMDRASTDALFDQAEALTDRMPHPKHKIELLQSRAIYRIEQGDNVGSMRIAALMSQNAREAEDPLAVLLAERVEAQALHWAGDHERAWHLADRVMRHPARAIPLSYANAPINRRVSMRMLHARILWLRGKPIQAVALMDEAVSMAHEDGPFSICFALAVAACPIAFWTGNLPAARGYTADLLEAGRRYTLDRWFVMGEGFADILARRDGEESTGFAYRSNAAVRTISPMHLELLVTIDSHFMTPDLAARAQEHQCGWSNPEMLRVAGEGLLASDPSKTEQASRLFESAIAEAQAQGALSWELRAATSLARQWAREGRRLEAHKLLGSVYDQFTEGFETADLQIAAHLLANLKGTRKAAPARIPARRAGQRRS